MRVAKRQYVFPLINTCWQRLFCTNDQHLDVLLDTTCRTNVESRLIANQHGCTRVFKREIHLIFCPPRVHGNIDGTNRNDCRKRHDPFGEVAHGNRNTVALFYAIGVHQQRCERINAIGGLSKRNDLVLVHKKCLVTMTTRAGKYLTKVSRGVFKHLHLDATHFAVNQLKDLPRTSYCSVCFKKCHRHVAIPPRKTLAVKGLVAPSHSRA